MNFLCTWDAKVIAITIAGSIIILAIVISSLFKLMKYQKSSNAILPILFISCMIIICFSLFCTVLFTPLGIRIDGKNICVNQIKGNMIIPLKDIEEIRKCNTSDIKNSIRKFGSGGFFGYLGVFKNSQLGVYQMYVTDFSNRVLIKTNDKKYVFSCEKSEEFIDYITKLSQVQ
jgi:hypothetical protein